MATIVVDCKAVRSQGLVELAVTRGTEQLDTVLFPGEVGDPVDFANWVLSQATTDRIKDVSQGRYTITAHQETGTDPGTGEEIVFWVVDDVTREPLPADDAETGFGALPGWATWSAAEAADWIEANVTDLASAKVALTAMARAIVFLRDWR